MAFSTLEKGATSVHERELGALLRQVVLRGEGLAPARELLDQAIAPGVGLVLVSAEKSGRLDTAAVRLAEMMRRHAAHRKAFLFSVGQVVFALSIASVVPSSLQFVAWILDLILLVFGGLLVLEGRRGWGVAQLIWKAPLVGRLIQSPAIIRIFTVVGIGIESGRSLIELLGECSDGEPNLAAARACEQAERALIAGATLHESLAESLSLEESEIALLMQGEQMGRVPQALHRVAQERIEALGRRMQRAGFVLIIAPYLLFLVPFVVLLFVLWGSF